MLGAIESGVNCVLCWEVIHRAVLLPMDRSADCSLSRMQVLAGKSSSEKEQLLCDLFREVVCQKLTQSKVVGPTTIGQDPSEYVHWACS